MTTIRIDDRQVNKALKQLLSVTGDGRPVFKSIQSDWYKQNRTLFKLKSKGQYDDLSEKYKVMKKRKAGFVYPILKAVNGRIESGLTETGSEYTVNEMTRNSLTLGVKGFDYGVYHQKGTSKMPKRPFIFNSQTGGPQYDRQMERWFKLISATLARRISAVRG